MFDEIETALGNLIEARHNLVECARQHTGELMADNLLAEVGAAEKHIHENTERWLYKLLGEIARLQAERTS
jgi:hypothetical protein